MAKDFTQPKNSKSKQQQPQKYNKGRIAFKSELVYSQQQSTNFCRSKLADKVNETRSQQ